MCGVGFGSGFGSKFEFEFRQSILWVQVRVFYIYIYIYDRLNYSCHLFRQYIMRVKYMNPVDLIEDLDRDAIGGMKQKHLLEEIDRLRVGVRIYALKRNPLTFRQGRQIPLGALVLNVLRVAIGRGSQDRDDEVDLLDVITPLHQ